MTQEEKALNDDFIKSASKTISKIFKDRINRPQAKPGLKYKRDWFDRLASNGNDNVKFFIDNFESVLNKTSKLSSNERKLVIEVFNYCLEDYGKVNKSTL